MSVVEGLAHARDSLIRLPRYTKRAILAAADFAMLSIVLWAVISLRFNQPYVPPDLETTVILLAAPAMTVAVFGWFGLYRFVTRYIGYHGNVRVIGCVALAVMAWGLLLLLAGQHGLPRSAIPSYAILAVAAIALSRQLAGWLLGTKAIVLPRFSASQQLPRSVLVVGAGRAGMELLKSMYADAERYIVGFVDNEPNLWGQYIGGVRVHRPDRIKHLIERYNVKEVLLAVSEIGRRQRQSIIKELQGYGVDVKILPSIDQIASGRVRATDLRAVEVGDLLGRDAVPPDEHLLARGIGGKAVLVTGAGGSIGSEIVRQIALRGPRQIVLFDVSEAALYQIDAEMQDWRAAAPAGTVPEITAILGSVLDTAVVADTLTRFGIEIIYHAAAYKHVPMVEHNFVVGLDNNVFGTATLAEAALTAGVERFVLISTDKAVRPHNVMGASKRLSEMILQAHASGSRGTVFTMVRFGNVLGSSGSVVPIFRKQIEAGGPVTVTHPEVVRYFMSIPEAAELVLQAGTMATGGEVFVLDMGEPVKIDALARLMIRLSGLEVQSEDTPDGDIRIAYTGLRPGEKLYEELLISANVVGTEHPRITRAVEPFLALAELDRRLEALRGALACRDRMAVVAELARTVEGYVAEGQRAGRAPESVAAAGAEPPPTVH